MKKILITGSSRGIGLAIAKQLLEEGVEVLGLSRKNALVHARFQHVPCDLSAVDGKLFDRLSKDHPDLDALICNAGFGRFGNLEEFSHRQIQEQLTVNFLSHACLIRSFLPQMKKRSRGHLLIIGSEAALEGTRKGTIYCASKFALRGFAQALRAECAGNGISVSMIHPGMVHNSFYENLTFQPGEAADEHLLSEDVAALVSTILKMRPGSVVDEILSFPPEEKNLLS